MSTSDNKRGRQNPMLLYHIWKENREKDGFHKALDKCQFLCTGFFENIQSHLIIGRKHKKAFTSILCIHSPWGSWPFAATTSSKGETPGRPDSFNYTQPPTGLCTFLLVTYCSLVSYKRALKSIKVTFFWADRELKDFFIKEKYKDKTKH